MNVVTAKPQEPKPKRCFFMAPVGPPGSPVRRATDGLLESVIRPTLKALNFEVTAPHQLTDPNCITHQMIRHLLEDDVVIVSLTTVNANVMYGLAVRHACRKPLVTVAVEGTALPFDVHDQRTLFFSDDMKGVQDLGPMLAKAVDAALNDGEADNPIYRVATASVMRRVVEKDIGKYVLERLERIEQAVARLTTPSVVDYLARDGWRGGSSYPSALLSLVAGNAASDFADDVQPEALPVVAGRNGPMRRPEDDGKQS